MHLRAARPLRPLSISLARFSSALAIAAAMTLAGSGATHATILDWDPAGNLSNSGGTGVWNLTNVNWNNGTIDVLWPNADNIARFGLSGGTVTLGAGISAGGLIFNVDGLTPAKAGGKHPARPAVRLSRGRSQLFEEILETPIDT